MSSAACKSSRVRTPARTQAGRDGVRLSGVVLSDAVAAGLAVLLSARLPSFVTPVRPLLLAEFAAIPLCIALLAFWGSYDRRAIIWRREVPAVLTAVALGIAAAAAVSALVVDDSEARSPFWISWLSVAVGLFLVRLGRQRRAARRRREAPLPVVILGPAENAKSLYHALAGEPLDPSNGGVRIAAIFAEGAHSWPDVSRQDVLIGETQWVTSFVQCCRIPSGIVAVPIECDIETAELVEKAAAIFKHLFVAPQIVRDEVTAAAVIGEAGFQIQVGDCFARSEEHPLKRMVDVTGALTLGLLTSPFLLLVALAICLSSKGPVLFKQLRIGKGNRVFPALKFRTMFVDSGERLRHYLEKDPRLRAEWESVHKLKSDPRVTSIGRFLRRFSFDELPQIWNVLVGDMSLVGPRPIVVSEIERYGLDYPAYEAVRPGLTGLWQVSGRNDTTYRQRVDYDSYYVRNWSLGLDLRIVAKTFRAVISGAGAY